MKQRCKNPKNSFYSSYGGRGIKVSQEFESFTEFFAHIGPRPVGLTLDRIDNDGDYAPGNVRWATPQAQMLNRSDNTRLTLNGLTKTMCEWSRELGISQSAICQRLYKLKWSVEKALTTPVMTMHEASKLGHKKRWNHG